MDTWNMFKQEFVSSAVKLIWGGVLLVAIAVFRWWIGLPWYAVLVFTAGVLAVMVGVTYLVLRKRNVRLKVRPVPDAIEAYASRTELIRARGQLSDDLKPYVRVWAIWHEGRVVTQGHEIKHCNIERLILTDPKDAYMMKRYVDRWKKLDEIDDSDVKLKSAEIEDTTKKIRNQGTEVRFYNGPTSCTLILADTIKLADDQFSAEAWARVESGIPFDDTTNRASVVITKAKKPEQFEALHKHYIAMWKNSRQAQFSQEEHSGSKL